MVSLLSQEMDRVARVPVWVFFPDLDHYLWSGMVLSKIASKLSKPLFDVAATTAKSKLSFSRVLVEIDVSKELPDSVVINLPFLGQDKVVAAPRVPTIAPKPIQLEGPQVPNLANGTKQVDISPSSPEVGQVTLAAGPELGGTSTSQSVCSPLEMRNVDSSCRKLGQKSSSKVDETLMADVEMHSVCSQNQPVTIMDLGEIISHSDTNLQPELSIKFQVQESDTVDQIDHVNDSGEISEQGGHKEGSQGERVVVLRNVVSGCLRLGQISLESAPVLSGNPPVSHSDCSEVFCVYESNDAAKREELWYGLRATVTSDPWIVLGDFNVFRSPEEKLSPIPPVLQEMVAFNSCLSDCQLDDISSTGCDLTWTYKQEPHARVWSKLDRAQVNPSWLSTYPTSSPIFQEPGISDHSPILVNVSADKPITRRFSFLNSWIDHPDYIPIVQEAWKSDKPEVRVSSLDEAFLAQDSCVSEDDKVSLVHVVSNEEIKRAVFGMDSSSSPGADGFLAGFFKSTWAIIGKDFCKAVHCFFQSGNMAKQANSTLLS
ncbi:uncharacterized protein LOC141651145 [Silene latifolia]|uniref:uncharacterized protein LOC141651145 n=1 Tax=Silene latifolia TaxID=37657 RepID=UPI003D789F7A